MKGLSLIESSIARAVTTNPMMAAETLASAAAAAAYHSAFHAIADSHDWKANPAESATANRLRVRGVTAYFKNDA